MAYKYITDNNLYEKQTYMYSEYEGIIFLKEYLESRQKYLGQWEREKTCSINYDTVSNPVGQNLSELKRNMESGMYNHDTVNLINAYTKSFEVRKRIYTEYDKDWRPLCTAGFENSENYLLFADCLLLAYFNLKCMKYFNCLLKVVDTLLSIQDRLDCKSKKHFSHIIQQELDIFYEIVSKNGISREVSE